MRSSINKILNLIKLNKFNDAIYICEEIKDNLKQNYEFINIHGYILYKLNNYKEAITLWNKVLIIKPDYFFALNNLGNVHSKLEKYHEAIDFFNQALTFDPNYFEASYGISEAYFKLKNYEDSLRNLNKCIKLKPDFFPAIKSKLGILKLINKLNDALKFIDEMIKVSPNNAYFYNEKGLILSEQGKEIEAINSYKSAYIIDPDYPFVLGNIIFDKLINCEWYKIENDFEEILYKTNIHKQVIDPLTLSYIFDSPALLNKSAKKWVKFKSQNKLSIFEFKERKKKEKINIGYFSADFRNHPVGHLLSRTIELHDKSKFNVHGFYFGNNHKKNDHYYLRLRNAFHKYHEVANRSDEDIINLARELKIDIAIDLMVHTGGFENRLKIFLEKCAPIQINFLGYPGTSGTDKIDYIIADKTLIEEKDKKHYSEKIIFLPNSYQPCEKDRFVSNKKITKEEFNLPDNKFVFCCFNSNQKILKSTFNLWVEILKRSSNSVLWLISNNKNFKNNFIDEVKKKNVNPERIIFADPIPVEEHLIRIKFADLFLDTFPYNAHTTCSDSIWAGVPVLTKKGKSFHSRVAASILNVTGLKELIVNSDMEYIDKAVKIAKDKKYLKNLKYNLKKSKDTNPLFDSKNYTKKIEQAYQKVTERYFKNQKPDDIYL